MPKTPATPSEIQNELDNLNATVQEAIKLALSLHDRITKVLQPQDAQDPQPPDKIPHMVCPLAENIRTNAIGVVNVINILQNALSRVEL